MTGAWWATVQDHKESEATEHTHILVMSYTSLLHTHVIEMLLYTKFSYTHNLFSGFSIQLIYLLF